CELLMSINNDTLTAIAFSTPNLQNLKNIKEIHIDAIYKTTKDFILINAIKNVWPNKGIQLCLWHLKKAILTKIKLNKQQVRYSLFTIGDFQQFPFIDPNFVSQ
ncbi:1583_t:CDS:2, partial [Cetraspora pellucida]